MIAVRASEIRNIAIAPITLPAWTRSMVQSSGLPATSRRRRIRSAASLPDSRRASESALDWNGAMMRSVNDSSYSRVSAVGALVSAWTRATERSTPLTACPDSVVPAAAETRTTARITSAPPRISRIVTLHLDLDQAAHPEHADGEDGAAQDQHGDPDGPLEQHHHVG